MTTVTFEPAAVWSLTEKAKGSRGLPGDGMGQGSPRSALHHWSVLWSRRSWGPLPSEVSDHTPFCFHSPILPNSGRDQRPNELSSQ